MKRFASYALVLTIACHTSWSIGDEAKDGAGPKTIVVDQSKFSPDYPAVWFSPSTGETAPIIIPKKLAPGTEPDPPAEHFRVFIEPNDPEFALSPGKVDASSGMVRLGAGDAAFAAAKAPTAPKFEKRLGRKELEAGDRPVYYVKTPEAECVVLIEKAEHNGTVLQFQWKRLSPSR